MNIAIVGATGVVGRKMIQVLLEEKIKYSNLYLFASKRSAGKKIKVGAASHKIIELTEQNIKNTKVHIALFSAGGATSKKFAPVFAGCGAYVIDNSSAFRMEKSVPLVVPEINMQEVTSKTRIIANPNCTTIITLTAINNIFKKLGIKRMIMSSYQAISGAGKDAIDDFVTNRPVPKKLSHSITNSLIPHIDVFEEDGYTKEEHKFVNETKKIFNNSKIKITATCVRVPVLNSHSVSLNIQTEKKFDLSQIKEILQTSSGVVLYDDVATNTYPMPSVTNGKNDVYVGRVRLDSSQPNTLNLFIVGDNIRKGAATNAVQIAAAIISEGLVDESM